MYAAELDHTTDAFGWRIVEPDGVRLLPDRLSAYGVRGCDVGRLQRSGLLTVGGRRGLLSDVSARRPGQRFALVMDTRLCDGAEVLADGADLLVCESTFLYAGARRLVLTHFSQRYRDESSFADEARTVFADVVAARDLLTVSVPSRQR